MIYLLLKKQWITLSGIVMLVCSMVGCGTPAPEANPDPPPASELRFKWTRDASLRTQECYLYDTYIGQDTKSGKEYIVFIGTAGVTIIHLDNN